MNNFHDKFIFIFILLHINCHASKKLILTVTNDFLFVSVVQGVDQLLGGLSGRLLASLKDVLVERHKLTLVKELGRGQSMGPHQQQSHFSLTNEQTVNIVANTVSLFCWHIKFNSFFRTPDRIKWHSVTKNYLYCRILQSINNIECQCKM